MSLSTNDYDIEEEFMKNMIKQIQDSEEAFMKNMIKQIQDSEDLENIERIKESKSIIDLQDFEYEEALRKDIEKELEIEKERNAILHKIEEISIVDEPDIPKTREEIRQLRLAFFDKKKV